MGGAEDGKHVLKHGRDPDDLSALLEAADNRVRDLGRLDGRWCRLAPHGHLRSHETRPYHHHAHPAAAERVAEAGPEAVEARLGCPVDEIGGTDAISGNRGEHDDLAVPLGAEHAVRTPSSRLPGP